MHQLKIYPASTSAGVMGGLQELRYVTIHMRLSNPLRRRHLKSSPSNGVAEAPGNAKTLLGRSDEPDRWLFGDCLRKSLPYWNRTSCSLVGREHRQSCEPR